MPWQGDRARELGRRTWALAGRASVRQKMAGVPAAMVLLVGITVAFSVRSTTSALLRGDLTERGMAIARETAGNAADLVLTNDLYGLSRLARRTVVSNPGVRYVLVLDVEGRPLVHTLPRGVPAGLLHTPRGSPATEVHTTEGTVRDVSTGILDGRAGTVRVGMSERALDAKVGHLTLTVLGVAGVAFVVALLVGFWLAGVLARPIAELVSATEAVGRGDFSRRVTAWAPDEIGQLALAFDDMVERLDASRCAETQRHREMSSLNAIGVAAGKSLDMAEVCEASVATAVRTLGADGGSILVVSRDGDVQLAHTTPGDACSPPTPDLACLCADVLAARSPRVGWADQACPWGSTTGAPAPWLACVPLLAEDEPIGIMTLAFRECPEFEDGEELLSAVGAQVGTAVQKARLWAEIRRREAQGRNLLRGIVTAQEDERRRVARELHDEAGQSLTSLVLGLRAVEEHATDAEIRREAAELRAVAADALDGIGRLALALRPAALDQLGLAPALRDLAQRQGEAAGIDVDVQTVNLDGVRLPREVEVVLYRVVQEALTNVCRHAHARHASVLLEQRKESFVAVVEDDGAGFDLAAVAGNGPGGAMGIFGMQERADLVEGSVTIESQPGRGTSVYLSVPVVTP